jgi:hypothetical protein
MQTVPATARSLAAGLLLVLGVSQSSASKPGAVPTSRECLWNVAQYAGSYKATRTGGTITLTASGTTGAVDKVFLARRPGNSPGCELLRAEYLGTKILSLQTFTTSACFEDADSKIREIEVQDRDGYHSVPVE